MTPDPRRGLLSLTWTSASNNNSNNNSGNSGGGGILKLEWKDRRTRTVVDTLTIFPQDDCTYSRVDTGKEEDRVYLLQFGNSDRRFFYWMQDKFEEGKDEDNCVKVNMYMADATEAAKAAGEEVLPTEDSTTEDATTTAEIAVATPAANNTTTTTTGGDLNMSGLGGGGLDNAALMQVMQGLGSTDSNNTNTNTTTPSQPPQGQVDALSNILENLGMPQPGNATTPAPPTNASNSNVPTGGGTLTLADLQGAMAGLATTSPTTVSVADGPPLSEVASSESVMESGILNDEAVKAKLIQLLPEEQRSEQYLEENLRSPQVSQCLKQLTATLSEDHDSLSSVLANFQLPPPPTGQIITNPIQAFLDSVLKSVEDEKKNKSQDNKSDENNNDDK